MRTSESAACPSLKISRTRFLSPGSFRCRGEVTATRDVAGGDPGELSPGSVCESKAGSGSANMDPHRPILREQTHVHPQQTTRRARPPRNIYCEASARIDLDNMQVIEGMFLFLAMCSAVGARHLLSRRLSRQSERELHVWQTHGRFSLDGTSHIKYL